MKKIKRKSNISRKKYSRRESIHLEKSMVEGTKDEVAIENMDAIMDTEEDEVGCLMMKINK